MPLQQNRAYRLPTLAQLSFPVGLTVLTLVLAMLPNHHAILEWSRAGLDAGQWWRLLSGHLLHSNSAHLWMNIGGLWLLFGLHQPHYRRPIWLASLLIMLFVSVTMYLWVDSTSRYVGLSALLHGLFTWGALHDIEKGWRSGWLLLLGVCAKVGWENSMGASDSTAALINARVAVESHLLGVIAAVLVYLIFRLIKPSNNITT